MNEHNIECMDRMFGSDHMNAIAADAIKLLAEVATIDGVHHKRWYLQQAMVTIRSCPLVTMENGIAP